VDTLGDNIAEPVHFCAAPAPAYKKLAPAPASNIKIKNFLGFNTVFMLFNINDHQQWSPVGSLNSYEKIL
jgi:hypothetical protein